MADDDVLEGYPDSPPEDLVPPEPPVSLDEAEREIEAEHHVEPEGHRPPDDPAHEDAFYDAPDADVLAALETGNQGSHPEDKPNFEDNEAEWSRERL